MESTTNYTTKNIDDFFRFIENTFQHADAVLKERLNAMLKDLRQKQYDNDVYFYMLRLDHENMIANVTFMRIDSFTITIDLKTGNAIESKPITPIEAYRLHKYKPCGITKSMIEFKGTSPQPQTLKMDEFIITVLQCIHSESNEIAVRAFGHVVSKYFTSQFVFAPTSNFETGVVTFYLFTPSKYVEIAYEIYTDRVFIGEKKNNVAELLTKLNIEPVEAFGKYMN